MKWKIVIALSIIGLILLFTNPTPTDFNTYLEAKNLHVKFGSGRKYNFLLFSIYTRNYIVAISYLAPSVIDKDSIVAPIHKTQEQYEQELKQYQQSRDSADKICKLKGFWTMEELYKVILINKPDLTIEQFQKDMYNTQNSYKLWENMKNAGNSKVPSDYRTFLKTYGFYQKPPSLITPQEPISVQHIVYDTIFRERDTVKNYIGILKNFF